MFEGFMAKMAGKFVAGKLNLQEGQMDSTKKWYQSKTMWSDVITILLALLGFVDKYFTGGHLVASPFYSMALTFLGAMGLYGRATADTKIG